MRITDKPWKTPARCIVVAHITQQTDNIVWIDTDAEIPGGPRDNHVYVSDVGVRQMMSTLGYPSPAEFADMEARAIDAEDTAIALADKLTAANEQLAAIGVLREAGMVKPRAKAAA